MYLHYTTSSNFQIRPTLNKIKTILYCNTVKTAKSTAGYIGVLKLVKTVHNSNPPKYMILRCGATAAQFLQSGTITVHAWCAFLAQNPPFPLLQNSAQQMYCRSYIIKFSLCTTIPQLIGSILFPKSSITITITCCTSCIAMMKVVGLPRNSENMTGNTMGVWGFYASSSTNDPFRKPKNMYRNFVRRFIGISMWKHKKLIQTTYTVKFFHDQRKRHLLFFPIPKGRGRIIAKKKETGFLLQIARGWTKLSSV